MGEAKEILELLSRKPLLKAQQIAEELGIEQKAASSMLRNQLNGQVVQNNRYRWRASNVG